MLNGNICLLIINMRYIFATSNKTKITKPYASR
nr:MAG TPA: INOSINE TRIPHOSPHATE PYROPHOSPHATASE [Caudoviricetes sp.]